MCTPGTHFVSGMKKIAKRTARQPMPPKKKNTPNFMAQSMDKKVCPTTKVISRLTKVLMAVPEVAVTVDKQTRQRRVTIAAFGLCSLSQLILQKTNMHQLHYNFLHKDGGSIYSNRTSIYVVKLNCS